MEHYYKKLTDPKDKETLNVQYAIGYTEWFINLLAIPNSNIKLSIKQKIFSNIKFFIIIVLFWWNISFRFIDMLINARGFDEQILLVAPLSFSIVILLKYIIILYRRKEIMEFIGHIRLDWKRIEFQQEKSLMVKNAQISNKITIIFMILMYMSGLFYNFLMPIILPILFHTKTNTSDRLPIFQGYDVIFNAQVSPLYEIAFFFEVYAVIIGFSILIFMCHLTAVSVTHACSQIQTIKYLLKCLIHDLTKKKTFHIKISAIVSRHVRILV